MLGCDSGAEDGGTNESTATSCAIEAFDSSWWNQAFSEQTGVFHVELAADVTSPNMDAVIGLSNGAATTWSSLAAIVRFNPQGYLDARDGATYRADSAVTYQANVRYLFRFDVDVRAHRYSVWFKTYEWDPYVPLAQNYAFRTEQAGVTRLTNIAAFVNPETSANGTADICGLSVVQDDTTGDNCLSSVSGGAFQNATVTSSSTVAFVSFSARAGQAGMDGVVGVASGNVDAYDDFAASIRFYTNGYIEARDGDQYRADRPTTYVAGETYDVRFVIDLPSHTYTVYVGGRNVDPDANYETDFVRLASGDRFRPAQAGVGGLDRVATIVASTSGRVDACRIIGGPHPRRNVVSMRDGIFDLAPRGDGSLAIASTFAMTVLDASNRPTASASTGGQVAADSAGNVYNAQVIDGVLYVRSYTPTLAPVASSTLPIDGRVADLAAPSADGVVAVVLVGSGQYDTNPRWLSLHSQTRQYALVTLPADTTAIGLGTNHFVLARDVSTGYVFETRTYENPSFVTGSREIAGNYDVAKVAVAPDGSFVIAGTLGGPTNFGDGEITYYAPTADSGVFWDWYIASFGPDFTTRFSQRMTNDIKGLVTNGTEIAAAYTTWTQLHYADYAVFSVTGTKLRGASEDALVGSFGFSYNIALGAAGRVYWNLEGSFGGPVSNGFAFLATLDP
jgi:hypothetical protein